MKNMKPKNSDEVIELYSGNLWEAELLKSILEDQEIPCFLKNNVMSSYAYKPGFSQEIKVMILQSYEEKAKAILSDFLKNNAP